VKRGIGLWDLLKRLNRSGVRPVQPVDQAASRSDLTTWSEIAGHLGVTERTAQTWHRDRGMPVRKLVGRAVASTAELDRWKAASASQPHPEVRPPAGKRTVGVLLSSILLFAIGGLVWIAVAESKPANLVRFSVDGNLLTVYDERDRRAWTHLFETSQGYPDRGWFFDLDADGSNEFLFAEWGTSTVKTVHCFRRNGSIAWSVKPGRSITNGRGQVIIPKYMVETIVRLAKPRADGGQLLVLSHHTFSWPAQLLVVTPDGRPVAEYWHPGWLMDVTAADLDGDGVEEILLGGVNNSFGETGSGASLVVLDSRFQTGQGQVRDGDWRVVQGVPPADPLSVRVFPRLPTQPWNDAYFTRVTKIVWKGDRLVVHTKDHDHWSVEYHLNQRLEVMDIRPSPALADFIAPNSDPEERRRKYWKALNGVRIEMDRMNPPREQAARVPR
jgi:hypothetical protein